MPPIDPKCTLVIEFQDFSSNVIEEYKYGHLPGFNDYYEQCFHFQLLLEELTKDPYAQSPETKTSINFFVEEVFVLVDKQIPFILGANTKTRTYPDGPFIRHIWHGDNLLDIINLY